MRARTRTVSCLIVATGASLLGDAALYAVLPSSYASAGITVATVGLVLSTNRLVRLFSNALVGATTDRIGRRTPFIIGMVLALISTLAYAASAGPYLLLVARAVWGIAWSLIAVSGHSMILDLSTDRDRGRLVGVYRGLIFFGGSLGMLVGGVLSDAVGFNQAFLWLGTATGAGVIVGLGLTETNPRQSAQHHPTMSAFTHRNWLGSGRLAIEQVRSLDRQLWAAAVLNLVDRFFVGGVIVSTLGLHLSARMATWTTPGHMAFGVASLTGVLLFLRSLVSVGSSPAFGHLSDLIKSRLAVMLVGLVFSAAGYLFLAQVAGMWGIIVGVILTALSEGAFPTSLAAWIGDMTSEGQRGVAVGLYATFGDIGAGLAPLTAYATASVWGLETTYAICAGALLTCLTVLAWCTRTKRLTD